MNNINFSFEEKKRLNNQLIKLGDMMGDGLHLEPGGSHIAKEYRAVCRALGIRKPRKSNVDGINEFMKVALSKFKCSDDDCKGELKQTRSGSKRAKCTKCNRKYLLSSRRKKS